MRATIHRLSTKLKNSKIILAGLSIVLLLPLTASSAAFADDPTCTPPAYATGVHQPIGADASQYTYDCNTGLWESQYYSYDPATGLYAPLYSVVYTYDPTTGLYDYPDYVYNSPSGTYNFVTQTTTTPPDGATVVGGPDDPSNTISNTGSGSDNTINDNNNPDGSNSIADTGSDSGNTINADEDNNTNASDTNNLGVVNNLLGNATTGNANVLDNTTAGDATTGDAVNEANIVNMLQSSSDALGGNAVTFVANINGDVNGDFLLNPADLSTVQGTADPSGNTTINNTDNATLTNNLTLGATSGDANVADNTNAGNATSGDASNVADVVNMIDSAISSGHSFLGVININGNLNGNILLPADFVNQLLADNVPTVNVITDTGSNSNNTINNDSANNTNVTNTNNQGITNNVNSTAKTGSASVTGNTIGGDATTGDAANSVTAFNLTGSNVVGSNDLLVFVNVAGGSWVGLIINAPPGASAAEFGGGVLSSADGNTTVNNTNNDAITNNINLNATSGDANETDNTRGGNATSGNASNATNLLNVEDSNLALSNWFGILFINVFGTWNGSVGLYNPAAGSNASTQPASFVAAPAFSFLASDPGSGSGDPTGSGGSITGNSILASIIKSGNKIDPAVQSSAKTSGGGHLNWLIIGSLLGVYALYWVGDRLYYSRHKS